MTRNEIRRNETTPVAYLLTVGQKMVQKMMNDKTQLVKEAKTTKQVVFGSPIKKSSGKMGLGKMLPNRMYAP